MAASRMKNSRFAGELLVAAELARLGLVVSLHNAFGVSTPGFDLTASTQEGEAVAIQVKALKRPNAFLIDPKKILPKVGYVFVLVGEAGTMPVFHCARGAQILEREVDLFGKWGRNYANAHGRGIRSRALPVEWLNAWENFGFTR